MKSCNFCIENLPDKNSKRIYDSILILEKILHKGMFSKTSNFLTNQLDKYYPKEKRIENLRLIDDKKQYWTDLTIKVILKIKKITQLISCIKTYHYY